MEQLQKRKEALLKAIQSIEQQRKRSADASNETASQSNNSSDAKPDITKIAQYRKDLARIKSQSTETRQSRQQLITLLRDLKLLHRKWGGIMNALTAEHVHLFEQLESTRGEMLRVSRQLQIFMRLNAINDVFFIWFSGPFATINDFKLGRLPTHQVDWNEVNAALGEAALCLHVIASKAKYSFKRYTIIPFGSFTRLVRLDERTSASTTQQQSGNQSAGTQLNLFTDGSFSLFPKRNFNQALLGLLACVDELGQYVTDVDKTLELPYKIHLSDGRVDDVSISVSGGDEDQWTRALKYLMTDIKWIVSWSAKHLQ